MGSKEIYFPFYYMNDFKQEKVIKAFFKNGYEIKRITNHIILTNGNDTVSIPNHKTIRVGLLVKLIRQQNLDRDEFLKLL